MALIEKGILESVERSLPNCFLYNDLDQLIYSAPNVNKPCAYSDDNMLIFVTSFKGIVVDLEDGNLLKLDQDGTVLRYSFLHEMSSTCFPKYTNL